MKSFYGGPKGENYVVSHIFPNRQSLFNDLAQGIASPVGLNEIIMISYGNYNSNEYETNLGVDGGLSTINPFYFTHNPFLYYEPSDKELNYETKYTILDERYGGSYNGIKNKQSDDSVWIQFLVQGTISFNGNFIKNVSDNNKEDYWKSTTAFHCYLATSIEAAKTGKSIKHTNFSIEDINEDSGKFKISSYSENLFNWNIETQNYEATIEGNDSGKPYYLIMRVMPHTAVTFGKTFSVTPFDYHSLFNYNSALFQKVLNTPYETLNPIVDVIESNVNNYAYKFLTSSLGTTPQIEIDGTIITLDYNDSPKFTKTEGSTWDRTKYKLQLPDQTQLKLSEDYKQLNIVGQVGKEEDFIIESYKFPEFIATYEEGNLVLYLKDLNTEQTQPLTSVETAPSFRITVSERENIFENQYILQYKFPFEKDDDEWHSVIDSDGEPINLNFQGSLISTAELEDKSGYKIFIDNKDTEKDETIVIKHGDKGDKGDTGKPLQISYSFNSKINSATEINFIDLSNKQQNNYIAEALNSQDIQFPYNLYDEDMEVLRLNEAFMGNIIYNNANKNLENILVFYFNTGKYAVEGEISAIADNEFVSNKLIEDEDADGNKIIKYQIISYSFLYFNNDITNTLIKNITSLDNQSLVFNTSADYDPTNKIFGAEGLTAGETNKTGTKVLDIFDYEGSEGEEGYYYFKCDNEQEATTIINAINNALNIEQSNNRKLKWSIKSDFCFDYAGDILEVSNTNSKNLIKLKVSNFYTNETKNLGDEIKYDSTKSYNSKSGRYNCLPLGYYIQYPRNVGNTEATEAILYICGYPEIGVRELFGQTYSFGTNNISQQMYALQVGNNNQGYNKYGVTIGQNNISGFGNAIFGRNINAGYAQMNISQGDYNKIGSYAKYDAQFGLGLNSDYDHQYQFGKYNKNKRNNIVEIGNGTGETTRSNLFEVDVNGKIYSNEMENMLDQKMKLEFSNLQNISQILNNKVEISETIEYQAGTEFLYHFNLPVDTLKNEHYYLAITQITATSTAIPGTIRIVGLKRSNNTNAFDIWPTNKPEAKAGENQVYYFYRIFKQNNQETYGIGITNATSASGALECKTTFYELLDTEEQLNNNKLLQSFAEINNLDCCFLNLDNTLTSEKFGPYGIYADLNNNRFINLSQDIELKCNLYIPSEFTQYNSQKWKDNVLKLSYKDMVESNNKYKSLLCDGLSAEQDVIISFNPQKGITQEEYKAQKEVYDLIISNSYAKTFNNEVRIYIMNDEIIDTSNQTECPILIKVV